MSAPAAIRLDHVLATLPARYAGPGGAVAVLREGAVLEEHTWGWADADRRLPFTRQTLTLICSITKQFTCGLILREFPDPGVLAPDISAALPHLTTAVPSVYELCHNQSGLHDYWAQAMACGAAVEGHFGPAEATRLISRARSLQFQPGTRYSYANQNFRLLSEIAERRTGRPFAELLRTRIFDSVGMPTALLNADTSRVAGGTIGYEGSPSQGFRPAVNHIHWTGDAGLAASLEDLVAWERYIDDTRGDPTSLYQRLSAPQRFRDGSPAAYGFGLGHARVQGCAITCHAGGLRGWRSFRLNAPAERISVVVLFNHMADARAAALELFSAVLGGPREEDPASGPDRAQPMGAYDSWIGPYLDTETGLAVRLEKAPEGHLRLQYAGAGEPLFAAGPQALLGGQSRLYRDSGHLWMERPRDHHKSILIPCQEGSARDIEGRFFSEELGAFLSIANAGGVLYGAFSGDLGEGSMQALQPFATDTWLLPCPRALDYEPPGDWTLQFSRAPGGSVEGVTVGCWLARGIAFTRCAP